MYENAIGSIVVEGFRADLIVNGKVVPAYKKQVAHLFAINKHEAARREVLHITLY